MQFDSKIFRFILSVQVSHPLNKPHLLREGQGNNQENCDLKLQLFKPRCLPLELRGIITL